MTGATSTELSGYRLRTPRAAAGTFFGWYLRPPVCPHNITRFSREMVCLFNLGFQELVVILILALVIFGPGKLPEVGKAMGKSINEFKKASRAFQDDTDETSQGDTPEEKKA